MSIVKQSSLFTIFLIVFGFLLRYYSVYSSGSNISTFGVALSVLVAGLIGGVGFFLGQLIIKESLAIKNLALSSIFVFFMAHNLSNLLGLYQISWFAYTGVLFSIAFVTALRAPKMFNKSQSTANKSLN
ncbi:hypothetical protein JK628_09740 [Shewanella sp. KX20019]|uniref:hypothetical protein n=1 Tax=Shewanella sp. KX20019 TaxID=2803864 RepID=UPI00192879B5|nr:hypothetical protein [Shewanella sp. KX20019]QQX82061.1 hypothetical protein JK628_09740 [Shewanella sp. KX20019]